MSESHSTKVLARLVNDVFPMIGQRPIQEISLWKCSVLSRRSKKEVLVTRPIVRSGPAAKFSGTVISSGRCEGDVCRDLRGALSPVDESHFAAIIDPEQLGGVLRAIYGYKGTLVVQCALKLLPMVFVRPFSLRTAKWASFDLDGAEWLLRSQNCGDTGTAIVMSTNTWLFLSRVRL